MTSAHTCRLRARRTALCVEWTLVGRADGIRDQLGEAVSQGTTEVADADGVVYGTLARRAAAFWLDWFLLAGACRLLGLDDAKGLVISAIYFSVFEGMIGVTLGKRLLRLRVVDEVTLGPIGIPRAVLRYVTRFVSLIPLAAGLLVAASDLRSRGWHDMLVHSVVVADT
jgi:uncharacterized RDD family membrane protein YckC